MLKHFLSPPNWFTSASIFCGFYAIMLAAGNDGNPTTFYQAGLLIGFAGVFDMLDGRVARMTNSQSEFGVQLDSLADVVSFGIAPAVLVYNWGLDRLGALGIAAAFIFVICGIFRLARFNVGAANQEEFAFSRGLTITMAGGTLAAMVMFHAALGLTFVKHPTAALTAIVVLAFLMVSSVPFRTAKAMRMGRATKGVAAMLLASLIVCGVFYDISFIVLPVMVAYTGFGLIEAMMGIRSRRREARAVRIDDE